MWNFIIEATEAPAQPGPSGRSSSHGLAVVLTTHSMEECDALCTRIGVMHQVWCSAVTTAVLSFDLSGPHYVTLHCRHAEEA